MLNPSLVALAIAVTAVLFAVNWYVWGLTYAPDFRLPSRMTPLSSEDLLIDLALGRVAAPPTTTGMIESHESLDGGFKRVA
jgi:hypothetical protein